MWNRGAAALKDVELAIIFGTDHAGGPGRLTPTRQNYATPLGTLPTDRDIVDGLADVLGPSEAFAEELHHINEHSIELAAVWFHYAAGGRTVPVVPILCGSFHQFITGEAGPGQDRAIGAAVDYLREATKGKNTIVIAAGDLAHVGPAFGDPNALNAAAKAAIMDKDSASIEAICVGDADRFFEISRAEEDQKKICGLPPIYMALRYLNGAARGESMGYDQCPADQQAGSIVSIVGALLWGRER
ncbi:MAG: AmmeMemoRadiSam system protein B [SAR202 cluster bacterium]|nr:AmmeMemoRadiSam system protein B [SAR202 cluster bacterium]